MFQAVFRHLETGGHVEDRPAFLDGDDPPCGEAGTIAIALHLVDDGQFRIAGPDEIAVQAVAQTALFHSAAGGHQRLRNHLAAINSDPSLIGGLAAEQIGFDLLQIEQAEQTGNRALWIRSGGFDVHALSLADFRLSTTSKHNSA